MRAARMLAEVRSERHREFERSARVLVDPGLPPPDHVEVLVREFHAIASQEAFGMLHAECGVTAEQFGERVYRELRRVLAALR